MIEIAPTQYWTKCSPITAIEFCLNLNIDGKTGWRLPTLNEWWDLDILPHDSWILDQVSDPILARSVQTVSPVRDVTF